MPDSDVTLAHLEFFQDLSGTARANRNEGGETAFTRQHQIAGWARVRCEEGEKSEKCLYKLLVVLWVHPHSFPLTLFCLASFYILHL